MIITAGISVNSSSHTLIFKYKIKGCLRRNNVGGGDGDALFLTNCRVTASSSVDQAGLLTIVLKTELGVCLDFIISG
jgi:hypothetical protein